MSLVPMEEYMAVAGEVITLLEKDADQLEAILDAIPPAPDMPEPPAIDKTKIGALKNIVYATKEFWNNVGRAGGWAEIGKTVGLWPEQAEEYALMMLALKTLHDQAKDAQGG